MQRILLSMLVLVSFLTTPLKAEIVWKAGEALLTDASQITSNNTQNGFPRV